MATTDPQQDLWNPDTPKKKPAVPGVPSAVQNAPMAQGPGMGTPASALDTGIPPPAAAAAAPAAQTTPAPLTGGVEQVPVSAPATSTPAPAGGIDPTQGVAQLNQTMRARHNRDLSPQEIQGLAQAIGAPAGPGGTYTAQQFAQAQDYVSRYTGDINNPFPAAPATPAAPAPAAPAPLPPLGPNTPTPTTPVSTEHGLQIINNDAALRIGRPLTPQEIQGLGQIIGAPAGPGGTYTPQQLQAARDWVGRYSGNLQTPWGELPESAPGSPSNLANQRISELLNTDPNEVDPNSQAIQQPLGAFRSAQSRATDRARMAMAQRNQAGGIAGGADEAGLLGLMEEQGQNEASFEANLYAQELAGQRSRLTDAIQLATQAGLQNKARQLQEKLGTLDIELRRLLGQGQLALGARSLDQNDRQFLDQMGFNYAGLQAQQNNAAIEQLLG